MTLLPTPAGECEPPPPAPGTLPEPGMPQPAPASVRLGSVRATRGPSLWSKAPVVVCQVELRGGPAPPVEAYADPLRALLAADGAHAAAPECWPEIVGRLAAGLQERVGAGGARGRLVPSTPGGSPVLVVDYEEEAVGVEALYEAEELVNRALAGEEVDAGAAVRRLRAVHDRSRPGLTTAALIAEARRRGIPVRRHPGDPMVQLGLGRNQRRIEAAMTDRTSVVATDLTSDKERTKRLLERIGLGVPEGRVTATLEDALEAAADLGFPVLLKPLDGNEGRGISGSLADAGAVRAAWTAAAAVHPRVMVERFVSGRDHRVVVVGGRVAAVAERVPAHVVGDGRRSVRALAEEVNRDPRRDPDDPAAVRVPLPLDAATEEYLARQGRSLDSVPDAGEPVALRGTANLSTGGTSIDRTDEIHPRNAALCELAASVAGLDIAGLDVLTPDISVPFDRNGAVVVEVNAAPGIRMHTDPDAGTPRDVPGAVLDMLFPRGSEATIPVVAVTGTNGKTTTTRLIAHLLRHTGRTVGFTTTDGVYFQEKLLMEGDLTGPFAANVVLSDPRVEAAVLETARGGILRAGLGFEACDVGVVLNVSADHLGLQGIDTVEQLAEVKALIPASVKPGGHAVLNADDPLVLAMRARTPGAVVLTSVRGPRGHAAVARHLAAGGAAVLVEEISGREWFFVRKGAQHVVVAAVKDVPLTVGGAARVQMENACAAIGAAYALGLSAEQIRGGLYSFLPSPEATPGRMNVLRTARGTVVVDYAHNPAAVRALADFARRSGARRCIGLVTMPGDRRDEDLHELGRLAGRLDYLVIKEHQKYRRGREPGEVARRIGAGAEAGGLAPGRWEVVLEEPAAVARALELMEEGDAVVILADESGAVLSQVRRSFDGG